MFFQSVCCAFCAWLTVWVEYVCMAACLPFCILQCVCACVCVFGWKYYLCSIIPRPQNTETYQGDTSNSCPRRYRFPRRGLESITRALGDSRSPQCSISPPPITKPGHFVWLLVIIPNNWNLIWQYPLPESYWSNPERDAGRNLVLFFIYLYIIGCPIRWHLHPVV